MTPAIVLRFVQDRRARTTTMVHVAEATRTFCGRDAAPMTDVGRAGWRAAGWAGTCRVCNATLPFDAQINL